MSAAATELAARRFAARVGDVERVVEQRRAIDLAAIEGEREQHAIELAAPERLAGRTAGLLPQVELELRPLLAKARQHGRQQERRDRRNDAHAQLAMQRPALRPRHFGQLLGLAKHGDRLVGDLLAERREADHAAGPFDQGEAEQGLEFAEARRQGRLGDEAGVGGLAEMSVAPQRDEILKLLDGRKVDDH